MIKLFLISTLFFIFHNILIADASLPNDIPLEFTTTTIDTLQTESTTIDSLMYDDLKTKKKAKRLITAPDYADLVDFCYDNYRFRYLPVYSLFNNIFFSEDSNLEFETNKFEIPFHHTFLINNYIWSNSILPSSTIKSKLNNYGNVYENEFKNGYYPYNVTLTRAYAGLGEYDNNFAHISLMKNHSLSVENLHLRFDFKAKDQLYENFNYKSSEGFAQADFSINNLNFYTNVILSNRDLFAGDYYLYDLFSFNRDRINDRFEFFSIGTKWSFISLNYVYHEHYLKSYQSPNSFKVNTTSIYSTTEYSNENNNLVLSIQKDYIETSNQKKFNQNHFMIRHSHLINNFKLSGRYMFIDSFDSKDLELSSSYKINENLEVISLANFRDKQRQLLSYRLFNVNEAYYGIGNRFSNDMFNVQYLIGQKRLYQENSFYNIKEDVFSFVSDFSVTYPVSDYKLRYINQFTYDSVSDYFLLMPQFQNIANLSLIKELHHDNYVSGGIKISALSEVRNEVFQIMQTNPLIDFYINIGISKLFNVEFQINNIIRNTYFGDKTLNDFNFTANMLWYFIN